jgi:hypothetical protein
MGKQKYGILGRNINAEIPLEGSGHAGFVCLEAFEKC